MDSLYKRRAPLTILKTLRLKTWDRMYKVSQFHEAGVVTLSWKQRWAIHVVNGFKTSVRC